MKIISTIALISINETLVVQLVSFLLFVFIMNRVMFRPLRSVISQRELHITHVQEEINGSKTELDDLLARMKKEEKAVLKSANTKRDEIKAQGEKEADTIFNTVQKQIHAKKQKAQQQINEQIEAAQKQIRAESEVLAISIIEKVLERRLAK